MRPELRDLRVLLVVGPKAPRTTVDALVKAAEGRGAMARVIDLSIARRWPTTAALVRGIRWCDVIHVHALSNRFDAPGGAWSWVVGATARAAGRRTVVALDDPSPPYDALEAWRAFAMRARLVPFETIACRSPEIARDLRRLGVRPTRMAVASGLDPNAILDLYRHHPHAPREPS